MSDTVKLLPCPFCGGKADWHNIGNEHTKSRSTKIWCSDCRFSKNVGAIRHSLEWTKAHAFAAWNRRTSTSGGELLDALSAEKPFIFDPGTGFAFADVPDAPAHGVRWAPVPDPRPGAGDASGVEARFPDDATPEMVEAALKVDWTNESEEAVVHNVWHAMRAAALSASPAATRGEDAARLLGDATGWEAMRDQLQSWASSAFVAGEKVTDEAGHKSDLYSFLCKLIGWLHSAEDAARSLTADGTCPTCNGHGLIGGWVGGVASIDGGGGYEDEPCPDCTPPVPAPAPADGAQELLGKALTVLGRCHTVLFNMAKENEGAIFNRWPIHHEPLRSDARNLLPLIDEVLGYD